MKTMAFKMASSKQYTKNNMPADLIALREKEKKKVMYMKYIYIGKMLLFLQGKIYTTYSKYIQIDIEQIDSIVYKNIQLMKIQQRYHRRTSTKLNLEIRFHFIRQTEFFGFCLFAVCHYYYYYCCLSNFIAFYYYRNSRMVLYYTYMGSCSAHVTFMDWQLVLLLHLLATWWHQYILYFELHSSTYLHIVIFWLCCRCMCQKHLYVSFIQQNSIHF